MGVRFFGQFLLERGIIHKDQLLEAITLQNCHNLRLGETAVAMGVLSKEEADRIQMEQRSNDLPFGEIAVKFGILTKEDIDSLLKAQKNNHIPIGQALVKVGAVTEKQLEEELEAFKIEQSQYFTEVLSQDIKVFGDEISALMNITINLFMRIGSLKVKLEGIEMLSEGAFIEKNQKNILIPLYKRINGYYLLSVPTNIAAAIAGEMFKEYVSEAEEELIYDAMKEFGNIVMGNLCAKVSTGESELEIGPPDITGKYNLEKGYAGALITLHPALDGKIYTALIWKKS